MNPISMQIGEMFYGLNKTQPQDDYSMYKPMDEIIVKAPPKKKPLTVDDFGFKRKEDKIFGIPSSIFFLSAAVLVASAIGYYIVKK